MNNSDNMEDVDLNENLNDNPEKHMLESKILYTNKDNLESNNKNDINNSEHKNKKILKPEQINIEEVLINLKMLSRINPNDKLYLDENLIKIDTPTIGQGIIRWFNEYSREKTMEQIDYLSHQIDVYINYLLNKTKRTDNDNRICQNILVEITKAISGLEKLKITYSKDTFIQSKLDMIQEKFGVSKNNLSQNLQVSMVSLSPGY